MGVCLSPALSLLLLFLQALSPFLSIICIRCKSTRVPPEIHQHTPIRLKFYVSITSAIYTFGSANEEAAGKKVHFKWHFPYQRLTMYCHKWRTCSTHIAEKEIDLIEWHAIANERARSRATHIQQFERHSIQEENMQQRTKQNKTNEKEASKQFGGVRAAHRAVSSAIFICCYVNIVSFSEM